jgi:hypothetical protein
MSSSHEHSFCFSSLITSPELELVGQLSVKSYSELLLLVWFVWGKEKRERWREQIVLFLNDLPPHIRDLKLIFRKSLQEKAAEVSPGITHREH